LSDVLTENVDPEAIFDHMPAERFNNVFKQVQEDVETVSMPSLYVTVFYHETNECFS